VPTPTPIGASGCGPGGGSFASNFESGGVSGVAPSPVLGETGIGGPGVAAGGVNGADPPDPEPEPPLLEGGVSASGMVGASGAEELSSDLLGAGFGVGARGGTGEIGNELPVIAGRTWAVTQTGVWLLEEE
jgi:hypothetical protein